MSGSVFILLVSLSGWWGNMLSIGAMSAGQHNYYLQLSQEDYYLAGGPEPPGVWLGQGAKALGLSGTVQPDELRNLFRGYAPDGKTALVQIQAGQHKERQPGSDLTWSPDKTVTALWAVGDAQTRKQIEEAHFASVQAGIQYLEDVAACTRRGKGGQVIEAAKLVVAAFQHGTSRSVDGALPDPQLHTHSLVVNVGVRQDGTTGTILSKPLYQHKMAAGAIYRAELSHQLEHRLGLVLAREKSWFAVAGVPKPLLEEFSKRRDQIEEALARHGTSSARAAAVATVATRGEKANFPRSELFAAWKEVGQKYGFTEEHVRDLLMRQPPRQDLAERVHTAIAAALQKIMAQQAHFAERDLVRYAAEEGQGKGLPASIIRHMVRQELANSAEIVKLGRVNGELRFTTHQMLELEKRMLAQVEATKGERCHLVSEATVQSVLAKYPTMKEEQTKALVHITRREGAIQVVSGMAGTGKTFLLNAAREAWEREGYSVLGAALAGKAARGLQEGAGIESQTIHRLLGSMEPTEALDTVKHHVEQIVRAARGKPTYPPPTPLKLDAKTVLVVDEAGMVGTRQMAQLVEAVREAKAKLVLVGDARQLQPVEGGAPFKSIGERVGQTELSDIARQRDERDRENVRRLARGDARAALADYAQRGLLTVAEDRRGAMRELIAAWKEVGVKNPKDNLIITGTNLEVTVLNRMAQEEREAQGKLGERRIKIGSEQVHENDRILFTRNSRPLGVSNGDLGTVLGIDPIGKALFVKLDGGDVVHVPLKTYQHVKLGYAISTHKGQGVTVEGSVFALVGGPMQDRELSYVQASRARGETRVFTDQFEAGEQLTGLAKQMSTSRQKDLAHDHLPPDREQEQTIELRR